MIIYIPLYLNKWRSDLKYTFHLKVLIPSFTPFSENTSFLQDFESKQIIASYPLLLQKRHYKVLRTHYRKITHVSESPGDRPVRKREEKTHHEWDSKIICLIGRLLKKYLGGT